MARYFREEDIDGMSISYLKIGYLCNLRRCDTPMVPMVPMVPIFSTTVDLTSKRKLEFRECFYLFARSGQIKTLDELTIIMRSLGLSPTIAELNKYLKDKGGKMSFADFLEVMHLQTRAEDLPKEVIEAFQAADTSRSGSIPARQLAHMLLRWGEQLSNKEVEQIFREANVSLNGQVKYEDFVKIACAPVPDYY